MNEKIKEFKIQARQYMIQKFVEGEPPKLMEDALKYTEDLQYEKFAELIIKECAGLVDHVIMEDGTRRSDFIRKHFGVEE